MTFRKIREFLAVSPLLLLLPLAPYAHAQPGQPGPVNGERYRPRFHFTPAVNWMNDPNGLVHYDGEYHLFYQHNRFGIKWGHMSWGHAASSDLVN